MDWNLMPFCDTDIPATRTDYHVNCGDAYASLSCRLCLRDNKLVRFSFLSFPVLTVNRNCSAQVNPKYSGRTVSKTNETRATRSPGSQMEVTVQTTYVRYPTSQSKRYDSNVGMDERLGDERREQSFDNDAESGV